MFRIIGILLLMTAANAVAAATIHATPESYLKSVVALKPGDTLLLAPGIYRHGLPLHGLQGESGRPIIIEGDASGTSTIFLGRPGANTISIKNAAHLAIRSLLLDGLGLQVDAVKAEGTSYFAHHITLERLTIINHGFDQQIVGISTKCPAWGWVIRGNVIRGAGTGMYLGSPDGSAPFIDGVIEHNLVVDTIGYNLQIKHQASRPAGMPMDPARTIIRHNVFSKEKGGSRGRMARPNVFLGNFPLSGAGAKDRYLVYGNLFHENHHEALLQVGGNAFIQANIFMNRFGDALRIIPPRSFPQQVEIVHNTVVAVGAGIRTDAEGENSIRLARANAVFASRSSRNIAENSNALLPFLLASKYLHAPMFSPGSMDFSPRNEFLSQVGSGRIELEPTSSMIPDVDFYARPFAKSLPGAVAFGTAIPWPLDLAIQPKKPR